MEFLPVRHLDVAAIINNTSVQKHDSIKETVKLSSLEAFQDPVVFHLHPAYLLEQGLNAVSTHVSDTTGDGTCLTDLQA
jgi:hypothetical protein